MTQESEQRYRLLSGLVSDLAYSLCVDPDGVLTNDWINDNYVKITGYSLSEIDSLEGFIKLIYPEDQTNIQKALKSLLTGIEGAIEYRIINKNGDVHWLFDHAIPVWNDDHTRVIQILVSFFFFFFFLFPLSFLSSFFLFSFLFS